MLKLQCIKWYFNLHCTVSGTNVAHCELGAVWVFRECAACLLAVLALVYVTTRDATRTSRAAQKGFKERSQVGQKSVKIRQKY